MKEKGANKRKLTLKDKIFDMIYLSTVGVALTWVMVSGIIDTTVFHRTHFQNLLRIIIVVLALGILLMHKHATKIILALSALIIAFLLIGLFTSPYEAHIANRFIGRAMNTLQFILGNRSYHIAYENFTKWALITFFSAFVVFFMHYKFRFWILFIVSIITTALAITSPYFLNASIFYVYVFCLLALVAKHLHLRNMENVENGNNQTVLINIITPVIAVVILLTSFIPTPLPGTSAGFISSAIRAPFDFFNDLFLDLTQQSEFSLRQVGFGGPGGRLGGDIEPNDDLFMIVTTNAILPLYLTGATRDTYTGYSWIDLNYEHRILDFDDLAHQLDQREIDLIPNLFWIIEQAELVQSGNVIKIEDPIQYLIDHHFLTREEIESDEFLLSLANETIFFDVEREQMVMLRSPLPYDEEEWIPELSTLGNNSRSRVEVNNLSRRMRTLFHTGLINNVAIDSVDDETPLFIQGSGNIFLNDRLRANTTYTIYFASPQMLAVANSPYQRWVNFGPPPQEAVTGPHGEEVEFLPVYTLSYIGLYTDILSAFEYFYETFGYDLWQARFTHNGRIMLHTDVIAQYFLPRVNIIRETYTNLPENFPDRVRELAAEVTAEAGNDYERARLLETFLSTSFAYTLQPGMSPHDRDFVDHFLFDLQQGYCVHFATAFVTMARSLGLPTRYVEGFYINTNDSDDRRGAREGLEVLNSMAHAWGEVYFEGFGWVRFEPTPAAGLEWQRNRSADITIPAIGGFWPEDELDFDFNSGWAPSVNIDNQANQNANIETAIIDEIDIPLWSWIAAVILISALALFTRFAYVHRQKKKTPYETKSSGVILQFESLLKYLALFGYTMKENETPHAFTERILNRFTDYSSERQMLRSSVDIFMEARFSEVELDQNEHQPMTNLINRLDTRIRIRLGKVKYFYYRYLVGKF